MSTKRFFMSVLIFVAYLSKKITSEFTPKQLNKTFEEK